MSKYIAYDINWDIDRSEAIEALSEMSCESAAKLLGIGKERYANMNTCERIDYAYDVFRHSPGVMDELFNLPDEIEIPDVFGITGEDDDFSEVTDWMSDEYGFCINGYQVRKAGEADGAA